MPDETPMNRRRFFREGFGELLKPLFAAIEPVERLAREISSLEPTGLTQQPTEWLRPPGALAESDFLSICSRCAECVKVCPAQCIKLDLSSGKAGGAPYIVPDEMPCVVCDGLKCMHVCPTGALVITPLVQIHMGTAVWNEAVCVRSKGEDCRICVERCPVGSMAIELSDGKVQVHETGCIGCGVCQHECPTSPKSIVVRPRSGGV